MYYNGQGVVLLLFGAYPLCFCGLTPVRVLGTEDEAQSLIGSLLWKPRALFHNHQNVLSEHPAMFSTWLLW
jgi:hypothetical protein